MRIQSLKIKNYKVLKDVNISHIPQMAVFLGMNGSGKTTLFDVFGFLHDCLLTNVKTALSKRGGFKEVISREQKGNIEFEIKFKPDNEEPLVTYVLHIGLNDKKEPFVKREILKFRRGSHGSPWHMLDFSNGEGFAIVGSPKNYKSVNDEKTKRANQQLDSPDILAIKGLGQFKEFPAISTFRKLIEDWHVSDFHIEDTRTIRAAGYSEQLSTTGENLSLVAKYMFENHKEKFDQVLKRLSKLVPGINDVQAEETVDGRIVLRFQDGNFKDPFAARYVSDGTIKMFTYLLLLSDPKPHALLCIEEPENQLYPMLLQELAEEFRQYSQSGAQVFISSHSPDFLNAVELDELYCLIKKDGYTNIYCARDNELVTSLYKGGDLLGYLWNQGLLTEGMGK